MKRNFTPLRLVFLLSSIVIFLYYSSNASVYGNGDDEIICEIIEVVPADYGKFNGSVTIRFSGGVLPEGSFWIPDYAVLNKNDNKTFTFSNLNGEVEFVIHYNDGFCGTYITHNPLEGIFCTYGIGFWGNKNAKGCLDGKQQPVIRFMEQALSSAGYDPVFGHDGASFTLTAGDVSNGNIFKILPGGGPSRSFSGNALYSEKSTWPFIPLSTKKANEGKSQNTLFSQALTLFFNLHLNPGLESLEIEAPVMVTLPVDCITGDITNEQDEKLSSIPVTIYEYLKTSNYGKTVGGLFSMANDALGGIEVGIVLSDIANGLAAVNEAFEGCRALIGWQEAAVPRTSNRILYEPHSLKVYPNPFSGNVFFEFVPERDAQARLELFDMLGQKITTLLYIPVNKGVMNKVEYKPDGINSGFLFYRLTLGDEVTAGKMLYAK